MDSYLKDLSCCTAAHLRYCGFAFLAPASITPAMQTMAKILTIEDDRIVGRDIVDTLCDAGFEVEWVMSGQDGIARAVHDGITTSQPLTVNPRRRAGMQNMHAGAQP